MRTSILSLLAATAAITSATAVTLQLDYTYDTSGFFGNSSARAALEHAADDLGALLSPQLGAITSNTITGTNSTTTLDLTFAYSFQNPTTGEMLNLSANSIEADVIRIYVGARSLGGGTLGQGGPAGAGFTASGSGVPSQFPGAVDNAELLANNMYGRGGGPTINTLNSSITVGSTNLPFSVGIGAAMGSLWFDNSTSWNFDSQSDVPVGTFDFYSVAIHEMLHVLGIGTAESWTNLQDGNDWNGTEALFLLGSGEDVVTNGHIAEGIMGRTLRDGTIQEAVMDPNITSGTRKYLTDIDAAFLRDIGWQTAAIPEPGIPVLSTIGLMLFAARRKRAAK